MLPDDVRLFSVDDHLVEHPKVWQDRLPASMRDAGPRVQRIDGLEGWTYQGEFYPTNGLNAAAGRDPKDFSMQAGSYEEMRPGCFDPVARLEDMDADGVHVQLCFPTFPRFSGTRFLEGPDRDLAAACVSAYNDFVLDEWCAADPERYVPMIILPLWDAGLSSVEISRCAERGARAISFPENAAPLGLPSIHTDAWDPVWAAAAQHEMPICMHIGTSRQFVTSSEDAPWPVHVALTGCNSMIALVDLLFSQVFREHPTLQVALSEGQAGWLPHILERADYTWERQRFHTDMADMIRPSDLFRDHIYMCFISDRHAIASLDEIPTDQLMWESDYPHSDTLWPNSRTDLGEALKDVDDDVARNIAELNARKLFRFW